ncbi:hypothetical protein ANN_19339 [Periplaneta americana]|uniref:Uncharacterized protein n=1 Tax=Periplaneta americana TaxID=6978 RepID=A0ABQ8SA03_PERAM|nr:hypothetical protein ANN_19339 [Periplaneta americana]
MEENLIPVFSAILKTKWDNMKEYARKCHATSKMERLNGFTLFQCLSDGLFEGNERSLKEVKTKIGMAKEAFNRKRSIFCGPLRKELRKRLVKCFVWSVAFYGTETWTLRQSEEKRIKAFEMWEGENRQNGQPVSPDFTACDYWLWGYLKEKVYARKPKDVDMLKIAIGEEIHCIPMDMYPKSMNDFPKR